MFLYIILELVLNDFILSLLYIMFYEIMNANFHIRGLFKKGSGF